MSDDFVFDFDGILNSIDDGNSSANSNPGDGDDCNSSDSNDRDGGIRK